MNAKLIESGRSKAINESNINSLVESPASKVPPSLFLALAAGAIALSFGLAISKKNKNWANFVGQWVPTILLLGIYDRIAGTGRIDNKQSGKLLH